MIDLIQLDTLDNPLLLILFFFANVDEMDDLLNLQTVRTSQRMRR